MCSYKFDTFENETEISQLIKNMQEKSVEYIKVQEPWEKIFYVSNPNAKK